VAVEDLFETVQPSGWLLVKEPEAAEAKKVFAMLLPQEATLAYKDTEFDDSELEDAPRIDIEEWEPLQVTQKGKFLYAKKISDSDDDATQQAQMVTLEAQDDDEATRWLNSIDSTLIAFADEELQGEVDRLVKDTVKSISAAVKQFLIHHLYRIN
jgi:hypothetical protein